MMRRMRNLVCGAFVAALALLASTAGAEEAPSAAEIAAARERVLPALVNISVVKRYFAQGRAQRTLAAGSGVVVSAEGYVLTNYHVAGNTTRITCTLASGETLPAKVVGEDPPTDLSVLQLDLSARRKPAPVAFAPLGDSDELAVGDPVLALGNPLSLASSLTLGIVSNTRRVFTTGTSDDLAELDLEAGQSTGLFTRWIQHDALILPGNSGGPLVNLRGEVVGINELGGGGVGFAIPAKVAARVLQAIREHGEVERGWLGVTLLPTERAGIEGGVLISAVAEGSPAAAAGLRPGDVLDTVNGAPVAARFFEEIPPLYQRLADLPVGKDAALAWRRGGEARSGVARVARMERFAGDEEELRAFGASVQAITDAMASRQGYPDARGVLVTGVRPGYPFESASPPMQGGDVLLSFGGAETSDLAALRKAVADAHGERLAATFRRGGESFVTLVERRRGDRRSGSAELPRPWLGASTQVVTPEVAEALGSPGLKGFRVTEVYAGSAAAHAGLAAGDVLVALNGEPLAASRRQDALDLQRAIEELEVGEPAVASVMRGGRALDLQWKLEAQPSAIDQAPRARQDTFEFAVRAIVELDRIDRQLPDELQGLIVTEVVSGGVANLAGLETDDVIREIQGETVASVADFDRVMKEIAASRPAVVSIFVRRGFRTHFVFLQPEWPAEKAS
jgi:serine protease Do